jgi:hypothetical protein
MITISKDSVIDFRIGTGDLYPNAYLNFKLDTLEELVDWMSVRSGTLRLFNAPHINFADIEFTAKEGHFTTYARVDVSLETLIATKARMRDKETIHFYSPAVVELDNIFGVKCLRLPESAKEKSWMLTSDYICIE